MNFPSTRAGDFTLPIQIQRNTEGRSLTGAVVESWVTFGERFARFVPDTARELYQAKQTFSEASGAWLCHGHIATTEKMRVIQGSRRYDVLGVVTSDGASPVDAPYLMLIVKEGISKGS